MADDNRPEPATERRASRRFGIELEIRYRLLDRIAEAPATGSGCSVNFSSRGLLFRTQQSLRPGQRMEIAANWPALLSGTCPLKLVALCRVVRAENDCVAARIEQYEFHTRRTKEWPKASPS
jgi:hypothetical protein